MNDSNYAGQQTARIATLNLTPTDERYIERFETAINESSRTNTDVLLLQGVVFKYYRQLQNILSKYRYYHTEFGDFISALTNRSPYGNIIISRYPLRNVLPIEMTPHSNAVQAISAEVTLNTHQFTVISADMFEGYENGNVRLRQARILNDFTSRIKHHNPAMIVVVGGAFKETDAADSIRYMKGLRSTEDEPSTFWTDVTEGTQIAETATTKPFSKAFLQNRTANLGLSTVPARKEDFLFLHGWAYGKPGAPLSAALFGTSQTSAHQEISNHNGICADLWTPIESKDEG